MKQNIVITLLLILLSFSAYGQKIKNRYFSKTQENGTLYYIKPMDMFANKQNGPMLTDITYLTSDSLVRVKLSFTDNNAMWSIDSVSISSASSTVSYPAERIVIEPVKKNKYHHRYSIMVPYDDVVQVIYSAGSDYELTLHSSGSKVIFPAKKRAWKKNADALKSIFTIISFDRESALP